MRETQGWEEVCGFWECAYCGHSHNMGEVAWSDFAEEDVCEKCGETSLVAPP